MADPDTRLRMAARIDSRASLTVCRDRGRSNPPAAPISRCPLRSKLYFSMFYRRS